MGLRLVAAGRVHEPEPEVADWSQAAAARDQGSDPDRRDRTVLSVAFAECSPQMTQISL